LLAAPLLRRCLVTASSSIENSPMISRRKIAKTRDDLPKSWRKKMSDALLTELASPAVFARGVAYFQQRKVALQQDGGGSVRFHVEGAETYVTDLHFADDELGGECTCPHAADGNFCKHAVAAALFWRAMLSGENPAPSAPDASAADAANKPTSGGKREALRQFVFAQSADALATRLWSEAERDRHLMAALKSWQAESASGGDAKALKAAITLVLSTGGHELDWRGVTGYAEQAERVVPLLQRTMAEHPVTAREACEHALLKLYKVAEYADDSNGEIGGLIEAVMDVLIEALAKAPPEAKWADRFVALQDADPFGLWRVDAVLDAAGPAVGARYSQCVDAAWAPVAAPNKARAEKAAPKRTFIADEVEMQRKEIRRRRLADLERRGELRAAFEFMRATAEDDYDYAAPVRFCEKHGWHREALECALELCKRFPDDASVEAALLRCYERDGWDAEAYAIRLQQVKTSPTVERFHAALRAAAAAKLNVDTVRSELFASLEARESQRAGSRSVSERVGWLLSEKRWQEALPLVQPPNQCHAGYLQALVDQLPASHDADAVRLLQHLFVSAMHMASSPYAEVLRLIASACKRMPPDDKSRWIAELRVTHKAKRNFVLGLTKIAA
jgi:hypothetical protein